MVEEEPLDKTSVTVIGESTKSGDDKMVLFFQIFRIQKINVIVDTLYH